MLNISIEAAVAKAAFVTAAAPLKIQIMQPHAAPIQSN
jgi:hypothetical protein